MKGRDKNEDKVRNEQLGINRASFLARERGNFLRRQLNNLVQREKHFIRQLAAPQHLEHLLASLGHKISWQVALKLPVEVASVCPADLIDRGTLPHKVNLVRLVNAHKRLQQVPAYVLIDQSVREVLNKLPTLLLWQQIDGSLH